MYTASVNESCVRKRDGSMEAVNFDKIHVRLQLLQADVESTWKASRSTSRALQINTTEIAHQTIKDLYSGISTSELDVIAAEGCATCPLHSDYQFFGGCILASNHQKNNKDIRSCESYVQRAQGGLYPLLSDRTAGILRTHADRWDRILQPNRDFLFDFFGMQTLLKGSYLLGSYRAGLSDPSSQANLDERKQDAPSVIPFETPQYYFLRVAVGLHETVYEQALREERAVQEEKAALDDLGFSEAHVSLPARNSGIDPIQSVLDRIEATYHAMSLHDYTHATPTMFHCGTRHPTLISCFLLTLSPSRDSVDGMYETVKDCANISKGAGGIGLDLTDLRSAGSYIHGTNGISGGIIPYIRVLNNVARHIDQGGGKRKGAFAMYLEPWHPDLMAFLDLKRNQGKEEERARDLTYGLFMNRIFMQRWKTAVELRQQTEAAPVLWSFMDPHLCPGLTTSYGEEFDRLYLAYEAKGAYTRQVDILTVTNKLLQVIVETGMPYLLSKDEINEKSNQKNIGIVRSSNLCTEIMEVATPTEPASCNLSSINLTRFVAYRDTQPYFDFDRFRTIVALAVRNTDQVIDINRYPIPGTQQANQRHRPIGVGVQGWANLLGEMGYAFDSESAALLNRQIFEVLYFQALTTSCELAQTKGVYPSMYDHGGAPVSKGVFQFDLWEGTLLDRTLNLPWSELRTRVQAHGVRNSLLVAVMPTASTSQIFGNVESIEPYFANYFSRKTKAGEFMILNPYLVKDLQALGLWKPVQHKGSYTVPIRERIFRDHGSVQDIQEIPAAIRAKYKTVTEIKIRDWIRLARERSPFIDQGQSLNVHFRNGPQLLSQLETYILHVGLVQKFKTILYYTRTIQTSSMLDIARQAHTELNKVQTGPSASSSGVPSPNHTQSRPGTSARECTEEVCTMCSS